MSDVGICRFGNLRHHGFSERIRDEVDLFVPYKSHKSLLNASFEASPLKYKEEWCVGCNNEISGGYTAFVASVGVPCQQHLSGSISAQSHSSTDLLPGLCIAYFLFVLHETILL